MSGEAQIRIVRVGPGRYRAEIYGEDHTLGNLIVKKILAKGLARFAYYEVPHPLEPRLVIYVDVGSDDVDPREVLARAADEALEELERFKRDLEEALARGSAGEEGG